MLSWVKTTWDLPIVSLVALLTCIVKCGKRMTSCVVSMTTLLCLMNCKPLMGPVNFFNTKKFLANVLSALSQLGVALANGFSNWPITTSISKLAGSLNLMKLFGTYCFILSNPFWAFALTYAQEYTKESFLKLLSKHRGT